MSDDVDKELAKFEEKYRICPYINIFGIVEKICDNFLVIKPDYSGKLEVRIRFHVSFEESEIKKMKTGNKFSGNVVYTGVGLALFTNSLPTYRSFHVYL